MEKPISYSCGDFFRDFSSQHASCYLDFEMTEEVCTSIAKLLTANPSNPLVTIKRLFYICSKLNDQDLKFSTLCSIRDLILTEKYSLLDYEKVMFLLSNSNEVVDYEWIELVQRRVMRERESLETKIKKAKMSGSQNLVNLLIDMGILLLKSGDFQSASQSFQKVKDFSKKSTDQLEGSYLLLMGCLFMGNYVQVIHMGQVWMQFISDLKERDNPEMLDLLEAKISKAVGVAYLQSKKFDLAARYLLLGCKENQESQSKVLSPNINFLDSLIPNENLALYLSLTLLATSSHSASSSLEKIYNSSSDFKVVLEENTSIRDILQAYISRNYSTSLNLLKEKLEILKLDIFLGDVVEYLYNEIIKRTVVDFVRPFDRLSLNYLIEFQEIFQRFLDSAKIFSIFYLSDSLGIGIHESGQLPQNVAKQHCNELCLVDFLVNLIASDKLKYRIDYSANELVAMPVVEATDNSIPDLVDKTIWSNQFLLFKNMRQRSLE